ncbi:MAG TPA: hypothetical protein VFJ97_02010 [Dermatophilaceae bacterium]|nr:hypothetical protein [Dermatophilaceae bacterium]
MRHGLLATLAMTALAGLDLLGAMLARRWAVSGNAVFLLLGALTFVVMFLVYAKSLSYAELVPVTFGWVVLLQAGLLVMAVVERPGSVPPGHWAAAAGMVGLEAYLLLSPTVA